MKMQKRKCFILLSHELQRSPVLGPASVPWVLAQVLQLLIANDLRNFYHWVLLTNIFHVNS